MKEAKKMIQNLRLDILEFIDDFENNEFSMFGIGDLKYILRQVEQLQEQIKKGSEKK